MGNPEGNSDGNPLPDGIGALPEGMGTLPLGAGPDGTAVPEGAGTLPEGTGMLPDGTGIVPDADGTATELEGAGTDTLALALPEEMGAAITPEKRTANPMNVAENLIVDMTVVELKG